MLLLTFSSLSAVLIQKKGQQVLLQEAGTALCNFCELKDLLTMILVKIPYANTSVGLGKTSNRKLAASMKATKPSKVLAVQFDVCVLQEG